MKQKRTFLIAVGLLLLSLPVLASRLGDIRLHARFLTDRMVYELRLTPRQYDDIFEINYDFLRNVDLLADDMARGYQYAYDEYYRYLDERNDDLRWVIASSAFSRFISIDYFYRPVYVVDHHCHLRIYKVYPNRTHFYYGRPAHYYSYNGIHCRHHCHGVSYYKKHYRRHYRHKVYHGHVHCRPEHRRHDYIVDGRPGALHHPPHSDRRPTHPAVRPLPQRPVHAVSSHPSRPSHPVIRPSRPSNITRPSAPSGNRPSSFRRPDSSQRQEKATVRTYPRRESSGRSGAGGGRKGVKETRRESQAVRSL